MSKLNSIIFNDLSIKYDELYSEEQSNLLMNEHPKIIIPKNNYTILMFDRDKKVDISYIQIFLKILDLYLFLNNYDKFY